MGRFALGVTLTRPVEVSDLPRRELADAHRGDISKLKRWILNHYPGVGGTIGIEFDAFLRIHAHLTISRGPYNYIEMVEGIQRQWAKIIGADDSHWCHVKDLRTRKSRRDWMRYSIKSQGMAEGQKVDPMVEEWGVIGETDHLLKEIQQRTTFAPKTPEWSHFRQFDAFGAMRRPGLIRRQREVMADDGEVWDIQEIRRVRRQHRYWHDKATERWWDSNAYQRQDAADKWLKDQAERGPPKFGGWRDSGDMFDEGNRVVLLCDGQIFPIIAGIARRERHYQVAANAA